MTIDTQSDSPEKVPEDVSWRLQRCEGFIDLRLLSRAKAELAKVPKKYHAATPYRHQRLEVAIAEKDWAMAAMLARTLRYDQPQEASHWVQLAYALRRFEDIESARLVLVEALGKFPHAPVIPFNLACYECQLGDRRKALRYLKRAIRLDPTYGEAALEDRDLEPLWDLLEDE